MGKISAMTLATAVAADNEFEINESLTTKKVTAQQLKDFIVPLTYDYGAETTDNSTPITFTIDSLGIETLAVPDEKTWKIIGDGLVINHTGRSAYFKFEAIIKNRASGADQHMVFGKLTTGGTSPSISTTNVITSFSGTSVAECISLGQSQTNGEVECSCDLGFQFVDALITIKRVGANFIVEVIGETGETLTWNSKVRVIELAD